MPRLPGKPSSVEADPRMLLTNTGEREKKGGEKEKKEERMSRVKSLLVSSCFLCTPVSRLHCT